ncbi:response regulator [Fibrisoma montanum]|uniref:Response regulator n=1 Tax=Fibrisoma montanum TaxID=2305895 RepID=A0A418M468_9BACT|nr:response regulator [Fibrisoma montanum]RIV20453.1 response regulator [Fibrisoma montanum]
MKILVVDDETDVQTLFEQRFRREVRSGEMQLAFCYSGEQAVDYLTAHHSEIVLILSDINMPGMSGFELLRHIRTNYPTPPPTVLMVTAYGDDQSRQQAISLGANDLLSKPLDFQALKEKLKSVV